MNKISTLNDIRKQLSIQKGCKVRLKENGGRRKSKLREGVLNDTYESIFTVAVKDGDDALVFSYTYSDVLTKAVELKLMDSPAIV